MADIFISYSKQHKELTAALARDLEGRGYTTWWDTSLLPGDQFPNEIKRQITLAKSVIVIWTESSITSDWVLAEATLANAQKKLITVRDDCIDSKDIPLPFNTLHAELIGNREKIFAKLSSHAYAFSGFGKVIGNNNVKHTILIAINILCYSMYLIALGYSEWSVWIYFYPFFSASWYNLAKVFMISAIPYLVGIMAGLFYVALTHILIGNVTDKKLLGVMDDSYTFIGVTMASAAVIGNLFFLSVCVLFLWQSGDYWMPYLLSLWSKIVS